MGQVTIYLDAECEARMKTSARARGIPISRWVAELVREKTDSEWPEAVRKLAGAWLDFPETKALRSAQGKDIERESF